MAVATVPSISATELHELLLQAHATGNVARKRFADAGGCSRNESCRSVRIVRHGSLLMTDVELGY